MSLIVCRPEASVSATSFHVPWRGKGARATSLLMGRPPWSKAMLCPPSHPPSLRAEPLSVHEAVWGEATATAN